MAITIGQWNMLASSIAYGEFLSKDDERTFLPWGVRQKKVVNVLREMFVKGCDFVVVVENDRPWEILSELKQPSEVGGPMPMPHIECVAVVDQSSITAINNTALIGGRKGRAKEITDLWTKQFGVEGDSLVKTQIALGHLNMTSSITGQREHVVRASDSNLYNNLYNSNYNNMEKVREPGMSIAPDTISIYYNSAKYKVIEKEDVTRVCIKDTDCCSPSLPFNDKRHYAWTFKNLDTNQYIEIIGAHLASGDEKSDHIKRQKDMADLKYTLNRDDNRFWNHPTFLVMDANFGHNSGDFAQCEEKLQQMAFIDGLGPDYMDGSFKMRHAQGSQPTKFCNLIFDRIDKIMYRTMHAFKPQNVSHTLKAFTRHGILTNSFGKEERKHEQRWANVTARFEVLRAGMTPSRYANRDIHTLISRFEYARKYHPEEPHFERMVLVIEKQLTSAEEHKDNLTILGSLLDAMMALLVVPDDIENKSIWSDKAGTWTNFQRDFNVSQDKATKNDLTYTKRDIKRIIEEFEFDRTVNKGLCERLEAAARLLMNQTPPEKVSVKTLREIVGLLTVPSGLEKRPAVEIECEQNAWGIVPRDTRFADMNKIYPNSAAPSDHPPYMVIFNPSP
jgi:hypothetical protein